MKVNQFCEKCVCKWFEYDDIPGDFVLLVEHYTSIQPRLPKTLAFVDDLLEKSGYTDSVIMIDIPKIEEELFKEMGQHTRYKQSKEEIAKYVEQIAKYIEEGTFRHIKINRKI